jgi:O-succinylbenzoate synthase
MMQVLEAELRLVALPLVRPFRTSFGEETDKRALLIRVRTDRGTGWGECVASPEPRYSEEFIEGARDVLRNHLVPALLRERDVAAENLREQLGWVRGNRMAKAALEMAILDAQLRGDGRSLASYLGAERDRVVCGVSVGIAGSIDALLDQVQGYAARGYRRVKLKIEPGWDVEPVTAVRKTFPDVPLSVDANAAYRLADVSVFEALDALDLMMVEQPLSEEDILEHAELQRRITTPICLDESVRSVADLRAALSVGACRIVNIKPGRVGGLHEAREIHHVARSEGIPVWCGGMLETGIGRAANLALAALPGFTLPGDTSASDRYFERDLTEPFVLEPDGTMKVPDGPGLGVEPLEDRLAVTTQWVEHLKPSGRSA